MPRDAAARLPSVPQMRRYCTCYTAKCYLTFHDRCNACRERKVKCSGSQPCSACARRRDACLFDSAEQRRITVSSSYLHSLLGKRKSSHRGGSDGNDRADRRARNRGSETERPRAASSANALAKSRSVPSRSPTPARSPDGAVESHINPLVSDSTRYLSGDDGRKSVFVISSPFPSSSSLITRRISRAKFILEFQFAGMSARERCIGQRVHSTSGLLSRRDSVRTGLASYQHDRIRSGRHAHS